MEVNIGVQNVARELSVETDMPAEEVRDSLQRALEEGTLLQLTDTKGRQVLVPARAVGWVQIGETERGRVGFGVIS